MNHSTLLGSPSMQRALRWFAAATVASALLVVDQSAHAKAAAASSALLATKPDWEKVIARVPPNNVLLLAFKQKWKKLRGKHTQFKLTPAEQRKVAEYEADMKKARGIYLRLAGSNLQQGKKRRKKHPVTNAEKKLLQDINKKYMAARAEFYDALMNSNELQADTKQALKTTLQKSVGVTGVTLRDLESARPVPRGPAVTAPAPKLNASPKTSSASKPKRGSSGKEKKDKRAKGSKKATNSKKK